jgi:hypothetical protein
MEKAKKMMKSSGDICKKRAVVEMQRSSGMLKERVVEMFVKMPRRRVENSKIELMGAEQQVSFAF